MKRKRTSDNFVGTQIKQEVIEDCPSASRESSSSPDGISTPANNPVDESAWPSCWTVEQKNDHLQKNDWLFFNGGRLGCSVCRDVGDLGTEKMAAGSRLAKEWTRGLVSFYGESRKQQLTSLRKKICEHRDSLGHKAAVKIAAEELRETLETAQSREREMETTKRIFRTVYKVARKNQSFNDLGADVDLQELNGIDVGSILYPATSCARIVDHIGSEMRIALIKKITDSKSKMSLLLDESTTVSQKPVLIVYIRSYIEEMDMDGPYELLHWLDVELDDVTANGIFTSLMSTLESLRITEEVLEESLVSLTCDGVP
ncbi:PREDICTED: uncharacterized protein KIAA1586-like [Gekko japonicus]|uniref:Uncharacterized protein KIAA1586-like n=1 Tax=Gekko japonicus TaxID=146911 RepID=A0ABM1LF59_GEKJA|nr:PREDICTED: uncharacterized protein KIAA1586-like [Gekko japonicus]